MSFCWAQIGSFHLSCSSAKLMDRPRRTDNKLSNGGQADRPTRADWRRRHDTPAELGMCHSSSSWTRGSCSTHSRSSSNPGTSVTLSQLVSSFLWMFPRQLDAIDFWGCLLVRLLLLNLLYKTTCLLHDRTHHAFRASTFLNYIKFADRRIFEL